jgi:hypothetical protein
MSSKWMDSSKQILPAVMVSVAIGATMISAESVAAVHPGVTTGDRALMDQRVSALVPAVLTVLAPSTYPVPDSLTQYTKQKYDEVAMLPNWDEDPDPTHCATISGSDGGWDDSDCS